jgi:uncharacterized membrane protein YhhN
MPRARGTPRPGRRSDGAVDRRAVTLAAWVFLAVAAGVAVADWIAVARGAERLEYACKPGTMAALVGVALAVDPVYDDVRGWFVLALVLSLLGDVFLMLPSDRFVAGLSSFLLAHVAYVVGLTRHGGSSGELALAAVPVALAIAVLGARFLRALLRAGDRGLVGPVTAYMLVIGTMVTCALASGNGWAAIGAVLFMASDSLIAETRFVGDRSWGPLAIIVTYHLGQAALTLSLVH